MKKLKSQQLIEFLFVAPFLVILLGLVTEFAYALNVNLTLNNGLRTVTSEIYADISPELDADEIRDLAQLRLRDYLVSNNVPYNQAINDLQVNTVTVGKYTTFIASYTYVSAFTLPLLYVYILPEQIYFSAISVVPNTFLVRNVYSPITSVELDKIWAGSAGADAFNAAKKGIVTETLNSTSNGVTSMAFLVPVNVGNRPPISSTSNTYYIVKWNGSYVIGPILVMNIDDNTQYKCDNKITDANGVVLSYYCTAAGSNASGQLASYPNLFAFDRTDYELAYGADILSSWLVDAGNNPFSGRITDAQDGALKRILSLSDKTQNNGNFDNLDVKSYNSVVSAGNKYKMEILTIGGSKKVFVHSKDDGLVSKLGG